MKYADGLVILGVSLVIAFICEGISWLLIYRTASYNNLKSSIAKTTKKVEVMKEKTLAASRKVKSKKIDRFENSLKDANQNLTRAKFQVRLKDAQIGSILF